MLPEGWHRSTLGEIARITSGGTPDRSESSYWGGSVPWVTTGEIQFNTISFRLFDARTRFFGHAAGTQPLVVVLDDLQWADTPSVRR